MRIMFLSSLLLLIGLTHAYSEVDDPIQDYVNTYGVDDGKALIRLDADINSDGRAEIFLSMETLVNGKAGNIWTVYVPYERGYKKLDKLVTFRRDAFLVEKHPDVGHTALLTYQPGGGGRGILIAIQLDNNEIKEEICEEVEFDRIELKPESETNKIIKRVLSKSSLNEIIIVPIKKNAVPYVNSKNGGM